MRARNLRSWRAVAFVAVLVGAAQADPSPQWELKKVTANWGGFSFEAPVERGCCENPKGQMSLAFSSDHVSIWAISVARSWPDDVDDELGIVADENTAVETMAAGYLAKHEQMLTKLGNTDVKLVDSSTTTVAGRPAFRVEMSLVSQRGLRYRSVAYGFITHDGLYLASFQAPVIYFYNRALPAFEQTVRTLKVFKPKRA